VLSEIGCGGADVGPCRATLVLVYEHGILDFWNRQMPHLCK
jgi:hypothetical protein